MEVTLLLISVESSVVSKRNLNYSVPYNNISNMFLGQCWRLETSSRPLYDFMELQDNKICQMLVVDIYHF